MLKYQKGGVSNNNNTTEIGTDSIGKNAFSDQHLQSNSIQLNFYHSKVSDVFFQDRENELLWLSNISSILI